MQLLLGSLLLPSLVSLLLKQHPILVERPEDPLYLGNLLVVDVIVSILVKAAQQLAPLLMLPVLVAKLRHLVLLLKDVATTRLALSIEQVAHSDDVAVLIKINIRLDVESFDGQE